MVEERKCTRCGDPESAHGLTTKHRQRHHFFARNERRNKLKVCAFCNMLNSNKRRVRAKKKRVYLTCDPSDGYAMVDVCTECRADRFGDTT